MNKKEKGLMDMDNHVVTAGGEGVVRRIKGNGKNIMKIKFFLKVGISVRKHQKPLDSFLQCHGIV